MVHATAHIDNATVVPTCGDGILGFAFSVARATIIVAGDAHELSMRRHLWRKRAEEFVDVCFDQSDPIRSQDTRCESNTPLRPAATVSEVDAAPVPLE
jgi:hypothetical protein